MLRGFTFYLIVLSITSCSTLFIWKVKEETIFCLKVCPLYCTPKKIHADSKEDNPLLFRRVDDDEEYYLPYHYPCKPWWFLTTHRPYTTHSPPTTQAPTTTTAEPTAICQWCKIKCNYPKS